MPEVDEVLNPTWSPDGKRIAFSGLVGGFNDLFVYDLDARHSCGGSPRTRSPSSIPPGRRTARRLAFSTDRFTTNLQTLEAGDLRLAIMDVASGEVQARREASKGPRTSARSGRPMASRCTSCRIAAASRTSIALEFGGTTTQLTNLLTGASGITELSPALSAAAGRVVFSAYEDDGYTIYALETPEQLAGTTPVRPADQTPRCCRRDARAPARSTRRSRTRRWDCRPPRLPRRRLRSTSRSWVSTSSGQPTVAVGVDPFGTYAAGGVSFVFSDMLGNHTRRRRRAGHEPIRRVRRRR